MGGSTPEVFVGAGTVPAPDGRTSDVGMPDDGEANYPVADFVRVYVAEDHPIFLHGLLRTVQTRPGLELAGHAKDGREALEQICELRPDVAVLDVRMPGLDGREVLAALRLRGIETGVVFLSAVLDREVFYDAIAGGASAYLSKQSSPEEVCDAIEAVARGETVIPVEVQAGLVQHIRERSLGRARQPPRLTPREHEVLTLIAEGCSAPEIGRRLYLSPATVKTHMKHLYEKLGVSERAAAIAEAMRHGLIR